MHIHSLDFSGMFSFNLYLTTWGIVGIWLFIKLKESFVVFKTQKIITTQISYISKRQIVSQKNYFLKQLVVS